MRRHIFILFLTRKILKIKSEVCVCVCLVVEGEEGGVLLEHGHTVGAGLAVELLVEEPEPGGGELLPGQLHNRLLTLGGGGGGWCCFCLREAKTPLNNIIPLVEINSLYIIPLSTRGGSISYPLDYEKSVLTSQPQRCVISRKSGNGICSYITPPNPCKAL